MEKLEKILTKASFYLVYIGAICLFVMMLIDTLNIIGIKFGLKVIPSGKTIIEELMTAIVFVGLGYGLLKDYHIKTEIVKKHFSITVRFVSDLVKYLLVICISFFIFWANFPTAIDYLRNNVTSPADIPIPMGPFFLLMAISFLNLTIAAGFLFFKECLSIVTSSESIGKDGG